VKDCRIYPKEKLRVPRRRRGNSGCDEVDRSIEQVEKLCPDARRRMNLQEALE